MTTRLEWLDGDRWPLVVFLPDGPHPTKILCRTEFALSVSTRLLPVSTGSTTVLLLVDNPFISLYIL